MRPSSTLVSVRTFFGKLSGSRQPGGGMSGHTASSSSSCSSALDSADSLPDAASTLIAFALDGASGRAESFRASVGAGAIGIGIGSDEDEESVGDEERAVGNGPEKDACGEMSSRGRHSSHG